MPQLERGAVPRTALEAGGRREHAPHRVGFCTAYAVVGQRDLHTSFAWRRQVCFEALVGTRILTLAPTADALAGGWAEDWANPWPKVESEPLETIDWDAQMRQHQRRVLVALLARGIMPERARELAQEAWLRVIEGHRSGRLRDVKLPGIVVAQASFLALDERRRSRRRADHDAAWEHDVGEGAEVIPLERQVLARDQLRRILDVVERAPQSAQRVFFLLYGKHVSSAAEVAGELGLSVQRVRQILCELRQKIRAELDEQSGGSK